ncbi:PAS domain S-box protein [Vampirovibrio chlorellavorus]|uniref:PAS domain S-box protein n=1 Tax=Vampirovibrio chlorellavorus TaxID=758823 RepID=UPI0026ED0EC8|nr:PAS domain S-box protein [Vampirovibrio chlorellavorus]
MHDQSDSGFEFYSESAGRPVEPDGAISLKEDVSALRRQAELQGRFQAVYSRLSSEVAQALPLAVLLEQVTHDVCWALSLPCARILELADQQGWILRANQGWNHHPVDELLPSGFGRWASYAMSTRPEQPVVFPEVLNAEPPDFGQPDYQDFACGVAVRIAGPGRGFGVLEVAGHEPRVFDGVELACLQTLGNWLGILIERKTLATEMLEVDDRMRLMMTASRDGIWEWDLRTSEVYWNDRLYDMLGLEKQQKALRLEDVESLYHPDDVAFLRAFAQVSLSEQKLYEFEMRMRHASGAYRLLYVRASVIPRRDGGLPRVVGLVSDITELKDVRQQVVESESRFEILANATPAFIVLTDTHGNAVYYNRTCQEFANESNQELVEKGWMRFVYPSELPTVKEIYSAAIPRQQPFTFEYRAVRPDGAVRFLRNNGVPRFQPDGQFVGYILLAIDATEERQSSLRMQRVMDANLIGILYTEMDGTVVDFNQAFEQMTGFTRDDLAKGLNMWRITPPEYIDFSHDMVTALKATGIYRAFEKQYLRKDGSRMDALVTVATLGEGDNASAVVLIMDISQQKQAQRDLQKNLERERLNRNILELASQARDVHWVIDQAIRLVGQQMQADRALMVYYKPHPEGAGTAMEVSYQYRTSDDVVPFLASDFSSALAELTRLYLTDCLKALPTPITSVDGFLDCIAQCLKDAPVPGEQTQAALSELKSLLLERYHIRSYFRLPVRYLGKVYGALNVQHCSSDHFWSEDDLAALHDVANYLGLVFYQLDLHQQEQKVLEELEKSYKLIHIISDAQSQFIGAQDNRQVFKNLLNRLLEYTNSEYGFIGEVFTDSEGQPYLKTDFLTDISWNEETNRLYQQSLENGMEFHNLRTLFGAVMVTGQVVIANDPAHDARRGGLPHGHPPLNAFMGLPIYKGEQLIGMVGLANRPQGYAADLADNLEPYLAACANLILAVRSEALRDRLTRELKLSEQALKNYSARLEFSNKELEQFATVASHDLQAPLRKVMLFGDYLKQSLADRLDEESLDYLNRMQRASAKMQTLINDLLALSRISRKGKPFVPVNLKQVAEEVVSDLEGLIRESDGKVMLGPMMTIDADGVQMQQILQNLMGNALKFHRPGVPPVIEVSAVPINDQFCEIRVQDNGIGFEEKYLDRIFTLFERLHGDQDYGGGSGLGLAIVKKIVDRHHGQVTAHSQVGVGTTFIVTLPIHQD